MVRVIILKNETVDNDDDDEDDNNNNNNNNNYESQRVFRIINCKSLKELNLSTNWFPFFDHAELISK